MIDPDVAPQHVGTNEAAGGRFSGGQVAELRASIASRLDDELRLEHLSQLVGLGVHHFRRVFRRTFGQPPHRYLRERRLERARDLLLGTRDPVGMIALRTGFSDQSHLTRCFKRHFGTPPAELRKRGAGPARSQRSESPCETSSFPPS